MMISSSSAVNEDIQQQKQQQRQRGGQRRQRPVAIITGGTRGIGSGIAMELQSAGYDLLLTYNTNHNAAKEFIDTKLNYCSKKDKKDQKDDDNNTSNQKVECISGDISLTETRNKIFECLDAKFSEQPLSVLVHNAGQYVGITSDNADGLTSSSSNSNNNKTPLMMGDGSLLFDHNNNDHNNDDDDKEEEEDDGNKNKKIMNTNLDVMHYYQRLYGDAFVDLCERSIQRMKQYNDDDGGGGGGSIIGISSPSVCGYLYGPDPSYSMPGSGKCIMEYVMRIYARQVGDYNINVNIIVPGAVKTGAWDKITQQQRQRNVVDDNSNNNNSVDDMLQSVVNKMAINKRIIDPTHIGKTVNFLCSDAGSFITGTVIPVDGGIHLKS